jgi:hypothetical protein
LTLLSITTADVVGNQIISGAIDYDSLKKLVANQRAKLRSATNSTVVTDLKQLYQFVERKLMFKKHRRK